ncbi:MAG: nitrate reductase subunit beta, partial [Dokdonella sp.]
SETCVGRIRYLGVVLYDADRIEQAASIENPQDLYQAQLDIFLDPFDPEIQRQAVKDGIIPEWIEAAQKSPAYKMAVEWKIAFPLHPEYRTLPMVWYVPPLSPITAHANAGAIDSSANGLPDVASLRIPVRYLANLLTAGNEPPIVSALERMMAMRAWFRARQLGEVQNPLLLSSVGLDEATVNDMHRYLAIANYEDRFVIPTAHREEAENAYQIRGGCGFTFGNGCDGIDAKGGLFGGKMGRRKVVPIRELDDHE